MKARPRIERETLIARVGDVFRRSGCEDAEDVVTELEQRVRAELRIDHRSMGWFGVEKEITRAELLSVNRPLEIVQLATELCIDYLSRSPRFFPLEAHRYVWSFATHLTVWSGRQRTIAANTNIVASTDITVEEVRRAAERLRGHPPDDCVKITVGCARGAASGYPTDWSTDSILFPPHAHHTPAELATAMIARVPPAALRAAFFTNPYL